MSAAAERRDRLRAAARTAGLDAVLATRLVNVRYLTGFTGSAGMLFVPSRRGISHSPLEWSDPKDICLGTQLLMDAIIRIANEKN